MKVRLKPGWSKAYPEFTVGNVYRVLGIENDWLRLIADTGEPTLFNPKAFEVLDASQPSDWIARRRSDGALYAYPPELKRPTFSFEDYFDYEKNARMRFHLYVHGLVHAEAAVMPDPPNTFIRVQWKHASPNDPVTLYSELDEARSEVRKVEVFADGRLSYAMARGSFGPATLGDQPVPSLEEIARDPQFEPTAIDRAEFEAIWDKALDAESKSEFGDWRYPDAGRTLS